MLLALGPALRRALGLRARCRRDEHARLLPRQVRLHAGEVAPEDVVHRGRHVLDPAARDDDHLGVGVLGDQARDLVERVERPRQLEQHHPGARDELRRQPVLREPAEAEPLGVRLERPLAEQPVLVRADPGEPVPRDRAERQRAVVVADHDDVLAVRLPRARARPRRGSAGRSRRPRAGSAPRGRGSAGGWRARRSRHAPAAASTPPRLTVGAPGARRDVLAPTDPGDLGAIGEHSTRWEAEARGHPAFAQSRTCIPLTVFRPAAIASPCGRLVPRTKSRAEPVSALRRTWTARTGSERVNAPSIWPNDALGLLVGDVDVRALRRVRHLPRRGKRTKARPRHRP